MQTTANVGAATRRRLRGLALGNAPILAVLRSPAHRLLSGMVVELRYHGRRSGREYALPVQYATAGRSLVVRPQAPERSAWWRNFRAPTPVQVRMRGRALAGTARVVTPGDSGWAPARQVYASRWRCPPLQPAGPLVVIDIEDREGETDGRDSTQ
jgi:deazaflavin-dependent oxidoreductase (nitroreductase family)